MIFLREIVRFLERFWNFHAAIKRPLAISPRVAAMRASTVINYPLPPSVVDLSALGQVCLLLLFRLDFRRSLWSGFPLREESHSSGVSAGSFPKQRLVIEPSVC